MARSSLMANRPPFSVRQTSSMHYLALQEALMSQIPEIIAGSLAPASLYALIGAGFVLIYRGTRVVNFAQGNFALIGALIFVSVYQKSGHSWILATAIAIGASFLFGAVIYRVVMAPLTGERGVLILIML